MLVGWKDEMDRFELSRNILGSTAKASVSVKQNWYVEIDYHWLDTTYSFIITRWMSNSQAESLRLFFKDTTRDIDKYGSVDMETGNLKVTAQQKRNIIQKCCEDLLKTLELIITHHRKSLLDYAVWYRDKRPTGKSRNTYGEFITVMACDCIIHGDILGYNDWKVIEFSE